MVGRKIRVLFLVNLILAFVGVTDASYLTYKHYTNSHLACVVVNGCDYVTNSEYSEFHGIPISLAGIFYYLTIICFLTASIFMKKIQTKLLLLNQLLIAVGSLIYIYLIYIQGNILNAYCIYCLFSAFCTFTLFFTNYYLFRKSKRNNHITGKIPF